jgi:hypothetical protein
MTESFAPTQIVTGRGIAGDIQPRQPGRSRHEPAPARPQQSPITAQPVVRSSRGQGRAGRAARRPFWRRLAAGLQYPLIAGLALGAAYSQMVGQIIIGCYIAIALAFRQKSRLSFVIALLILASVLVFQALGQTRIAQTAALYLFEVMAFATLQVWHESKLINRITN